MTCNDTAVLRLLEDEEALVDEDGVFLWCKKLGKREKMKGWETWRIIPVTVVSS